MSDSASSASHPALPARAERRLAAIIESSDDAIVSKDLNGIITSWNRAAERMFGYSAAEVIGESITIIIPTERLDEEKLVLSQIRRGEKVDHFETIRRRKDGTLFPISLTVSPIRDDEGNVVGASKIARDISERVRLQKDLEEASRIKDEFLATLSHELRTPLNAILGYSKMIRSGLLEERKRDRAIEVIERNALSLAQIVEDVLDVARITAGKLRLTVQTVDPAKVVTDAVDSVMPAADARGVRIETRLESAGTVTADPDRLQQVLWNLLTNAVKFTGRDGRVDVILRRDGEHVEIAVADTGAGIPADFLPFLFDRFRQADARTTREQGGLGLGLAIARHLVEMHGGTISASSPGIGQGSTFRVRIPAQLEPSAG